MSALDNMVVLWRLLENIADGLDEYVVAAAQGNGGGAREVRRRCIMTLDSCFDLLDRWIEQCHGLAAQRQAEGKAPKLTVNGRLH